MNCRYKPLQLEAIEVTESNYQRLCDFIYGHRPTKADNPTIPRGKYFGVFVETRHGRQLARVGEFIVRTGETEYRVYSREEFVETFELIESERKEKQ